MTLDEILQLRRQPARNCATCGVEMVTDKLWTRMTPAQRDEARARNMLRSGIGPACIRCEGVQRRAANRAANPPAVVPAEAVVEDWLLLRDRERSQAANIRLIAPRVGMTEVALEKAILRAKRRGLLERAA